MVADNGSDWYFQGDSDDGWDAMASDGKDTLIDEISGDVHGLHGSDFEAIDSGPAISDGPLTKLRRALVVGVGRPR